MSCLLHSTMWAADKEKEKVCGGRGFSVLVGLYERMLFIPSPCRAILHDFPAPAWNENTNE